LGLPMRIDCARRPLFSRPAYASRLVAAGAMILACACSRRGEGAPLVIGIQSDEMGQIVSGVHVIIKVGGKTTTDETILPPHGSRVGFPQPWEKKLLEEGDPDAPVDVQVFALGGSAAPAPLITRLASTHFPATATPGKVPLLRVQLESRCVVYPPPAHPSKIPGPLSGPVCEAPSTCIRGTCQSDVVSAADLEAYAPDWPTSAPDLCKPRDGGAPSIEAVSGQAPFAPIADGQVLQAEPGSQGGHHIWLGVRMKNLRQAGSITKITGVQPGTGTTVVPSAFAFTYDPDPAAPGSCQLSGLRYQLDTGGIDYVQFLGKPLDVTLTVTDRAGATASTIAHVQIAPTLHTP